MLELRDCKIGKGTILYSIDQLVLQPGRLVVLIGANGAGKSTLLDAIAIGQPKNGTITFKGQLLQDMTVKERSRCISLVESQFAGAEYLSTVEYLELGRFPYTGFQGRLTATDTAIVEHITISFGLTKLLQQPTMTLSDGERQRASIARALIQETPIVLLDEPTSFLDYPNKRAMMRMLQTIAHSEQKIVLLASHDLELCLEYSDECLVVNPRTGQLEQYQTANLSLEQLIALAFDESL